MRFARGAGTVSAGRDRPWCGRRVTGPEACYSHTLGIVREAAVFPTEGDAILYGAEPSYSNNHLDTSIANDRCMFRSSLAGRHATPMLFLRVLVASIYALWQWHGDCHNLLTRFRCLGAA